VSVITLTPDINALRQEW